MKIKSKNKKNTDLSVLKNLLEFIAPYKLKVFIVFIALITTASSVLILGYGLQNLIDKGFSDKSFDSIKEIFLFLVVLISVLALASFIRASTIYIVCERVEADIRTKVYNHIINLSPEFFEINKTSDIISRLTVDTAVLNSMIANLLSFLLRNMFMLIGGLTMLFLISFKLSLMVIAMIPFTIAPILFLSKKIRRLTREAQDKTALISSQIEESLNGIKTVQSFHSEEFEKATFSNLVENTFAVSRVRYKHRAILSSMVISIALLSIAFVLFIGSNDVITGNLSAGSLSSFIFYAILVATSIAGIGDVIGELHRAASATDRIFELLAVKSTIEAPKNNVALPVDFKANVNITNMNFSYPARPNSLILQDFNLSIKQGETIAIVGQSGSGKTTIFNLLLRFYNLDSGEIKLGDINIKSLPLQQLRSFYALVPQDPTIFSATAYDNIKYGNNNATEQEIIDAAKSAEIYDFLIQLPDGLKTFLGEKGIRISGGQKQRIAIARAILKDPKILLLDEATNALDSENERSVKIALDRLKKGRTTIMISHRFSTIADADRIILLNSGKIEAIGNYKELEQKSKLFKSLANNKINMTSE